jgi:hypothetical protein
VSESPLPDSVARVLGAAGWHPGYARAPAEVAAWEARLGPGFAPSEASRAALRRYGGLEVRRSRGAIVVAHPFHLDPALVLGEDDRFADFRAMTGIDLFPLGEVEGHVFLAIAPTGEVFAVMLDLWKVGDTMEDALAALVAGRPWTLLVDERRYRGWIAGTIARSDEPLG